jgi:hypothetical protein
MYQARSPELGNLVLIRGLILLEEILYSFRRIVVDLARPALHGKRRRRSNSAKRFEVLLQRTHLLMRHVYFFSDV